MANTSRCRQSWHRGDGPRVEAKVVSRRVESPPRAQGEAARSRVLKCWRPACPNGVLRHDRHELPPSLYLLPVWGRWWLPHFYGLLYSTYLAKGAELSTAMLACEKETCKERAPESRRAATS
jgi:hypothetical protein